MFGQLISLSLLNLTRARTRLLLTTGGVLVATTGIIMLVAFSLGLQNAAESGLGSNRALTQILVTFNPQNTAKTAPKLTIASVQKISRIPGVKAVIPMINVISNQLISGANSQSLAVLGVDPALLPELEIPAETGTLTLTTGQIVSGPDVGKNFQHINPRTQQSEQITLDMMTARLKLRIQQENGSSTATREVPLKVVGLLQSGSDYDTAIFVPMDDAIAMNMWIGNTKFNPKAFVYDQIVVRAQSRDVTNRLAKTIEQQLGFSTSSLGDVLDQMNSFFSAMHLVLGGIGMITLLVAAVGVANTMMMATRERIKEIGLMKAIGGTDEDILTIFLLEAGLIGAVGSLGGAVLSLLLQNTVNQAVQNLSKSQNLPSFLSSSLISLNTPIIIPPELLIFAIVLTIAVSVASGLYPALWAARLSPVTALKQG